MKKSILSLVLPLVLLVGWASASPSPNPTDGERQFETASSYYDQGNYTRAAKWFRKAAEQGNAKAQSTLGAMYAVGQGVPQDSAEAVKWFRKAAEQDFANAQYNLGQAYHKGDGVPQDYAEAAKWYRKAAEQGNALAQNALRELGIRK